MKRFVLLFTFCLAIFGRLFHLDNNQVVSNLIFFNKTYLEIQFQSSNQYISVWLKPYSLNYETNESFVNKNCLLEGTATNGSTIRGTAIISVCDRRFSGLFEFNGNTYSLNWDYIESQSNFTKNIKIRKRRKSPGAYVMSRIEDDPDEKAYCANSFQAIDNIEDRIPSYELIADQPDVNFGRAVIKLSVFLDEMLFRHRFNGNIKDAKYFVAINIAYLNKQLKHKNIMRNVQFELVIAHFSVAPFYEMHMWEIGQYLNKFCRWVRTNTTYYSQVNILFSGSTLWWLVEGELSTKIKGMASVGMLCDPRYSCMIIEGREGFKSVRVLVHEFGHNLGAHHDGEDQFKTAECDKETFIMSWAVGHGKNTWSECSVRSMRRLLLSKDREKTTNRVNCLTKEAVPIDEDLKLSVKNVLKPGASINPDEQCRLIFGPRFKHISKDMSNVCLRLRCKDDFFITTSWGALEGTECGFNRECNNDRCRRVPLDKFNPYIEPEMS